MATTKKQAALDALKRAMERTESGAAMADLCAVEAALMDDKRADQLATIDARMRPGLKLALTLAEEKLEAVEQYLSNKADADCDAGSDHFTGNDEMHLWGEVQQVRATLQRIIREAQS